MSDLNMYYVYQLRLSGSALPFYIGKGKGNRVKQHFWKASLGANTLKANLIKKALREGVEVLIEKLAENLNEEQAYLMEVTLISLYGRRDISTGILANMADGGEGGSGVAQTREANVKRSVALKGKIVPPEVGKKISEAKRGKPGNRHSEETRQKMSASKLGLKKSPETIERMKLAAKKRAAIQKANKETLSTIPPSVSK